MERNRYDLLKQIKLDNFDLLKCDISDPVYKFCLLYGIDNLGDFIKIYEKNRYIMDVHHNFNYFDGIVNLINLVYFGDKIEDENTFYKKIVIFKHKNPYCNYARIKDDYHGFSLRRLGFTKREVNSIMGHALYLGKDISVINTIKSYLKTYNFKRINEEKRIYLRKLNIINDYYEENLKNIKKDTKDNLINSKKSLQRLVELNNMKKNLENRIKIETNIFLEEINKFSKDDEGVKNLIKSYNKIYCNEE